MECQGLSNWSGNFFYTASALHEPHTTAEVQDIVRRSSQVRALGSRHCFNTIADSDALISLRNMKEVVSLDTVKGRVIAQGGITYGELCPKLDEAGLALHNTASLPHISVAGAIATATHGSGQKNGNLASAVCGLQLVTGLGDILELDEETDAKRLHEAVVGLGCLGIVTRISLKVEPRFEVLQRCFDGLYLSAICAARLDEVLGAAYSVSLFTEWKPVPERDSDIEFQIWMKQRLDDASETVTMHELLREPGGPLRGCVECSTKQHPLRGTDPIACTDQGSPGPWYTRLPHFRMEFTPSAGEELQSEYFVPREQAAKGLNALRECSDTFRPFLIVTEVRAIAADSLLMSPHGETHVGANGSVGFHFTWKREQENVMSVALPAIEKALEPLGARPHWGKLFAMGQEKLELLYGDSLSHFRELAKRHDPNGKFCNQWARDILNTHCPGKPRL